MKTDIREQFVELLRSADPADQCVLAECICTPRKTFLDAYGVLATLFMTVEDLLVGFVPLRNNPNEYFFLTRTEVLGWSGLTSDELTQLIDWNDSGLTFAEIADRIEQEWA